MQNHNDDKIKTSDTDLLEKYTSHFIWKVSKGLPKVLLWEGVENRTELQHIDPHSIGHNCVSFPVLLGCSTGGLGAHSAGCWFFLPHLISNWLNFLCTKLYNSSTSAFFLWASQIALIQSVHGQGYILIFLDRIHLLFTQVHFLFWQPGQVGGQYTTNRQDFECWFPWQTNPSSSLPKCCIVTTNYTYTYACGNIVNTIMTNEHTSLEKYNSHFIRNGWKGLWKGCVWKVSWRLNKLQHIDPPVHLSFAALLSRSVGLLNRGSWGPIALCWVLVLSTASYLHLTETVCGARLYNCLTSTCFLWASHLHPIQPSTVKVIPWYLRPDAPVIYTGAFVIW